MQFWYGGQKDGEAAPPAKLGHTLRSTLGLQQAIHERLLPSERGEDEPRHPRRLSVMSHFVLEAVPRIDIDRKWAAKLEVHVIPVFFNVGVRIPGFLVFVNLDISTTTK